MTTKVFVGNLAFQTTDQALAEAFKHCGRVNSGVIITRGRRSLGYGFVDFVTADDAANAVEKMNQTEFLNRTIKVELVRDPPPPRPPRQIASTVVSPQSPSGPNVQSNPNENVDDGEAMPAQRRPKRNRRRRKGTQVEQQQKSETSTNQRGTNVAYNNESNLQNDAPPPRRNNNRRYRVYNNNNNNNNTSSNNTNINNNIKRNLDTPQKEKILSKTAVFVANLPFSVKDEGLKKIFEAYHVKTAHVVQTRSNRSRGYGFVDFASEDDQKKAIDEKNEFPVLGESSDPNKPPTTRKISVTVSHSVAPQNEEKPLM